MDLADRPNALSRLVSNRVLRNCVSLRPYQARRVEHSFHLRHQREALAAKNFKCDCPAFLRGCLPAVPEDSIAENRYRTGPLVYEAYKEKLRSACIAQRGDSAFHSVKNGSKGDQG